MSREADAKVAEALGWKRVQAPKYDFDGPLPDQGEVLVPPGFDESRYEWPSRGIVPLWGMCPRYSDDLIAVVEGLESTGERWLISKIPVTAPNRMHGTHACYVMDPALLTYGPDLCSATCAAILAWSAAKSPTPTQESK